MFKIQLVHRFNQALLLTMLAVFGMVTNADVDQSRLDAVKADLQSRIDENKLSGAVVMSHKMAKCSCTKLWVTRM